MRPGGLRKRWRPNDRPRRDLEWLEDETAPTRMLQEIQGGAATLERGHVDDRNGGPRARGSRRLLCPSGSKRKCVESCVEAGVLRRLPDRREDQRRIVAGVSGAGRSRRLVWEIPGLAGTEEAASHTEVR
ncbi:hypothetical protein NDU88_003530 [Pleurodeles waltl]|uniref:Uncharacterized protein n=1 Tax=Pleurodeles waltl TaxID=8319 RepID=A0AAV7UEC2_PLEWA|nr:hypothetical protein NDU88_003530 [Pleurodeles waltl]